MTYALGIDIGTTYTAAAVARNGRAEVVALGYRATSVPTVVCLAEDGRFLVGDAAERRAATSPDRVAREFKRRVGDPTPLLLGGSPIAVDRCLAEVLRWVVAGVAETEGRRPDAVTVTHPANWGEFKRDVLRQALRWVDLPGTDLLAEPVAAATWYAQAERLAPGSTVAVYDLGGGTFDAAVLRRRPDGLFENLGRAEGIERLGGIDIDQAIFGYVVRTAGPQLAGLLQVGPEHDGLAEDPAMVAATANLRRACVEAKEGLSVETSVTIPVWFPNLNHNVLLRRSELEELVWPLLAPTIDALVRTVHTAGLQPDDLDAVLLVGGSSRVPLVARQVSAGLGRPVVVDAHPKHPVAMGAALDAAARVGTGAGVPPGPPPGTNGNCNGAGNGAGAPARITTLLPPTSAPVPIPVPAPGSPGGPGGPFAPGMPGGPPPPAPAGPGSGPWPAPPPGYGPPSGSGPRHAMTGGRDRRPILIAIAAVAAVALVVALVATNGGGGGDGDDSAGQGLSTTLVPGGTGEGAPSGGDGGDSSGDADEARFAWQASVGEATSGDVIALDGERVYIVDDRGQVSAFELTSGNQAWTVDLGDESTGTNPVRVGDVLLVGISEPTATFALDAATGQQRWKAADIWIDDPLVAGDVVLGHTGNTVTGLDLGTGQVRWQRDSELWAWGNMAVAGDVVVTGSDDGRVEGIDPADGSSVWVHPLPRGDVYVEALTGVGNLVVAVDDDQWVTALDAATGTERWSKDMTANYFEPPLPLGDVVVVPVDGGLNFVDPETGQVLQNFNGAAPAIAAAPGGTPAVLFTDVMSLQAVDMEGRSLWSTGLSIEALEVEVTDGYAVVSDYDGNMAVFTLTM